jgi:hypothetical protein
MPLYEIKNIETKLGFKELNFKTTQNINLSFSSKIDFIKRSRTDTDYIGKNISNQRKKIG